MKRRIVWACIALFIVPVALALFAFALPAQYTETFLGGFADKLNILRGAKERRIILTGGSGAAFAVRSDLLEQELPGYRVVNMGMYAGLGSAVPLSVIKQEIREGDIVIFLPEQSAQTLSMYFGSEAMWQAADGHWELLRCVPWEDVPAMLGQFPYFAARKARAFFRGEPLRGDGVYTRSAFNQWGDIDGDLRPRNDMPGGFDGNTPVSFAPSLPAEDFITFVNDYAEWCAQRGAAFWFGFCPMNEDAISGEESVRISTYTRRLSDALDCPILGSVQDSVMEAVWFFDTNFHLNGAGAIHYTATLARQIRAMLGMPEGLSFPLPEPPDSMPEAAFVGDDSDADCFEYRDTANGLEIVGLTQAGAGQTTLTLPTRWRGRPVVSLSATTFAGNSAIEALTVQQNLRALPDGAFDGCSSLQKLILRGIRPSECAVGAELLRGTGAMVCVDVENFAAFQTNYFWAQYAARIRAMGAESGGEGSDVATKPQTVEAMEEAIIYDANGGYCRESPDETACRVPIDATHLRTNTLPGTDYFLYPGHALIGWNTAPDGSGQSVGLGSRVKAVPGMTLYAQWTEETAADAFDWKTVDGTAWITAFHGLGEWCVVPSMLGELPVAAICADAFRGAAFHTLVLPPTLRVIEESAFADCKVRTLYMFDALKAISDASFAGCDDLMTLHINAATPPVYSISYYATFADKYDWLFSLDGQKKLVLFSGSATRYGYDSAAIHRAYPSWAVANMGVYAYTNALPQLELILQRMEPGDVLLHAPEFDTLDNQFCATDRLDHHFWAMMEANYDCVAALDLRGYSQVFDSLQKYLAIRRGLPARAYTDTPNGYDDDGNDHRSPTYNPYGDFSMAREGCKIDVMLQHIRADYTPAPFTEERLARLNAVYQRFLEKDIQPLFAYTPRNRSALTEDSTPENRKALAKLLRERLCVPIITSMEDSLMPGTCFYLIDSHLSSDGVRQHTQRVIQALKPWLGSD